MPTFTTEQRKNLLDTMALANIEKELKDIKAQLEKLKGSCKSADELSPIQDKLGKIDSSRKDGKFVRIHHLLGIASSNNTGYLDSHVMAEIKY